MNGQVSEFIASGVLYVFLYAIAGWGLNLQFGTAGIINFGYIMCEALGAYTVALFAIGKYRLAEGEQHAIFALALPFPIPVLLSLVVGAIFSAVIGVIVLRRVRQDQQAVVLLAITLAAVYFVQADPGFLNGAAGISLIPQPVIGARVATPGYEWAFVSAVAVVTVACWWLIRATTESPFGRALRALRDHESGAQALGYGAFKLQLKAFVLGGVLASLAGGILAYFVTTWSPAAWGYTETFWFFAVVIVGGTSNLEGIAVGALIIVGLQQAFEYLPTIGASELGVALQTICAAVLTVGFLALRPKGILPERKHRVYDPPVPYSEPGRELADASQ